MCKIYKKFKLFFNDFKIQSGATECGIYCIRFLHCRISGIPFVELYDKPFSDKKCIRIEKCLLDF